MKKKNICLLLFLWLSACFLLTGCHGAKETIAFTTPEQFNENETYEITFWAKNDTNVTQANIYKQAILEFEKLYPNITVNLRLYTDYSKIYNDVITNISTGTTPNVCITYPDHIATYLTGENVVVPLDDLFDDGKYGLGGSEVKFDAPTRSEMVEKFLDECILSGYHYAVPYMRSTEALYINKTYVEKLGYTVPDVVTWDWIFEVSDAAKKKNDDGTYYLNGGTTMRPFIYKSTDNMMIQMLAEKDAGYSDENGNIYLFNDTTKELLLTISEHCVLHSFSTFKQDGYPANFLNAGQCVFAVDSTAGSTWMGPEAPLSDIHDTDIVDFEIVVRAIPQFDTENPKMISQGPSVCIFNKEDPQEVLASWLFVQYLLTNDIQIAYAETEGYVPVTWKAQNSEEYQDYLSRSGEDNDLYYSVKLDATKLLLDNIENTFITPVFNGSASLREAAGSLIEAMVSASWAKETVDDSYLDNLFDETTSLYRLDQINISDSDNRELGPLPAGAKALLITLAAVWAGILVYLGYGKWKTVKGKGSAG